LAHRFGGISCHPLRVRTRYIGMSSPSVDPASKVPLSATPQALTATPIKPVGLLPLIFIDDTMNQIVYRAVQQGSQSRDQHRWLSQQLKATRWPTTNRGNQ
jgi:hypothetical protein